MNAETDKADPLRRRTTKIENAWAVLKWPYEKETPSTFGLVGAGLDMTTGLLFAGIFAGWISVGRAFAAVCALYGIRVVFYIVSQVRPDAEKRARRRMADTSRSR